METLRHIREIDNGRLQDLPVIALTANTISGAREMFRNEGFTEFIPKPIEQTVLERVLRKTLPKDCIQYHDTLLLHPIIVLKKSRMVVSYMLVGGFAHVARSYVRKIFVDTRSIDRRILFITYSGMDEQKLQYLQALVRQYCPFERVYLQKASSAIASNCGLVLHPARN